MLMKIQSSNTCRLCAPSTVGDSPYRAAAQGARSLCACIAPASAAIGRHTNTSASKRNTCKCMSNVKWSGTARLFITLSPCFHSLAPAVLLEEEEEAEEKCEEEGVSGVRKCSSKNSSIAASSLIMFSFPSSHSPFLHALQIFPLDLEWLKGLPHSEHRV